MTEFQVGDVVYLKSNPQVYMTVRLIHRNGDVEVAFYNDFRHQFEYPKFDPAMLVKVKNGQ